MKIRKSKEILVLTQSEKAILAKAYEILDDIYDECESDGDLELLSDEARGGIGELLENVEVEGGEPTGEINITIMM